MCPLRSLPENLTIVNELAYWMKSLPKTSQETKEHTLPCCCGFSVVCYSLRNTGKRKGKRAALLRAVCSPTRLPLRAQLSRTKRWRADGKGSSEQWERLNHPNHFTYVPRYTFSPFPSLSEYKTGGFTYIPWAVNALENLLSAHLGLKYFWFEIGV